MLKKLAKSNQVPRFTTEYNYTGVEVHEEYQYLNLISDILEEGSTEMTRNGYTKSVFGATMCFSLQNNKIPILTTKKVAWKTCLKELLWFISGKTDNQHLRDVNVHIWDANGSREFLDSRGLINRRVDDLGPIYGHQWRHFNAPYVDCDTDYTGKGIDQLQNIIDSLKDPSQRTSRRMVLSAWNPCQLDEMALPPCHVLVQFNVHDGNKLSCMMTQRSCDCCLGQPFNIASYAFLTHLLAKHCELEAYEFIYSIGNCHIYEEHYEGAKEQLKREPYEFPTITIKQKRENIDDYVLDDFELTNYKCHDVIKMKMVA